MDPIDEIAAKLDGLRSELALSGFGAARLRGTDWFAWATAGGSNAVLLSAESGVAELLVTADGQWLLTSEIEASRMRDEEVPELFAMAAHPWTRPEERERLVREVVGDARVASDRPEAGEVALPAGAIRRKRSLLPSEIERYRRVGAKAAEAVTEVLEVARESWTERELAGAAADALWARGLHPALTLAAGERRLPLYRHPTPRNERLGRVSMLVVCARGGGLYANLTRFLVRGLLTSEEHARHAHVRTIESRLLDQCRPGARLADLFALLPGAYAEHGYPGAVHEHHQGGTTGYLSREVIAGPDASETLCANMAIAFNPSVRGAKIEDTFLVHDEGRLENLTYDPRWPSVDIGGRSRPLPLEAPPPVEDEG